MTDKYLLRLTMKGMQSLTVTWLQVLCSKFKHQINKQPGFHQSKEVKVNVNYITRNLFYMSVLPVIYEWGIIFSLLTLMAMVKTKIYSHIFHIQNRHFNALLGNIWDVKTSY